MPPKCRMNKASADTCGADEKSNPWVRRDVSPAFDVHRLGAFSQLAKHDSQQDDQKRLTPGAARATAKALATSA